MADSPSDDSDSDRESQRDETNCKVGRLIDEHELDGLGQELGDRWTASTDERSSLRELADMFNRLLLEAVLDEANVETIEGESENIYRLLTDDDVTTGVRTEVRNRLERNDVDVDELEREFVSHQAIHTYLTKYRNVTREKETLTADERRSREVETIRRLQSRTAAVTGNAVDRLRDAGHLSITDPDVISDVQIICNECGSSYSVEELFQRTNCDCYASESTERLSNQ